MSNEKKKKDLNRKPEQKKEIRKLSKKDLKALKGGLSDECKCGCHK